ncbi:MAG: cytochrome c oxidase subunit 3 [Candidatus Omnitrophota bacterium]|nr:cytochrome c oxidase subunit 3 [Candidatus Omnitrophota bacterium]MDZ4242686.1 cytochrome c oxidase subunit 3 [Candidatus Omnitrophota bacterium]
MSDTAIPYTVETRHDTGLYNAKMGIWLFLASEIMLFGALFSTYIILRMGAPHWPHGSSILNVPIGTFNTVVLITSSMTMVMSWASLKLKNPGQYRVFMGLTILLALTFLLVKSYEYGAKFEIHYEHTFPTLFKIVFASLLKTIAGWGIAAKIIGGAAAAWAVFGIVRSSLRNPASIPGRIFLGCGLFIFLTVILSLFELGNRGAHHHYPPSHNTFMAIYFTLTGLHGLHVLGGIIVNSYFWGPGRKMWESDPARFTNRIEIAGLYWHFVDLVWIFLFPVLYLL